MQFEVTPVHRTHDTALEVHGELDVATVRELGTAVRAALDRTPARLLLDLTHTRFIDSTGCRELVRAVKAGTAAGVPVEAVVPPDNWRVRRVVDLVQLSAVVAVHDVLPTP